MEDLISHFKGFDLVLLEGNKHSSYKKIEIVRRAISDKPVCNPATLIALYTDTDCEIEGIKNISIGNYDAVAACIFEALNKYKQSLSAARS